MKSFLFYAFHYILIRCQTQDNELGVTCGTYVREEKCTKGVCRVPEGQNCVEDVSIGASMILKWTIKKY
jgi:hypothetical protein